LVHLLPDGQAYLDAGEVIEAGHNISEHVHLASYRVHAQDCYYAVYRYLLRTVGKPAEEQHQAMLLSAAGVRLVLELQLLAAADYQRWQQQQQVPGQINVEKSTVALLSSSNRLLHTLIRAVAQASGSCLPPEVLQQAGLQLLQALTAPLQQLQLSGTGYLVQYAAMVSSTEVRGHMGEACQVLLTAACGPAGQTPQGEQGKMPSAQQPCDAAGATSIVCHST
jgi:hypothetical protein